jgi:type I site-specific restriction endonuclease
MSVITIQEEGVEISFTTMKELSRWAVDVFKMDQRLSGIASSIDDNDVSPDTFRVIAELLEKHKTHGSAMPRRHIQALLDLSVRVKSVLDDVLESNEPVTKKHKGDTKIKVNVTVNSE